MTEAPAYHPTNALAVAHRIVGNPKREAIGTSVQEIGSLADLAVRLHHVATCAVDLLTATEAGTAANDLITLSKALEQAGYLHFINEVQ